MNEFWSVTGAWAIVGSDWLFLPTLVYLTGAQVAQ